MDNIKIGGSELTTSAIIAGCMRISKMTEVEASRFVASALDNGITMFDHADIYGGGISEEVFAAAVKRNKTPRQKYCLQSKACIRKGLYDCSEDYILKSVDGILKRLETDYLDLFLVHRPDTLMEPDEIAAAFDQLESSGKVRHFGISNSNAMQIQMVKKSVRQPLVANQLQFSIMHTGLVDSGINVNMKNAGAVSLDGHILEYCRLNDITIQAWSPLQFGFFEGTFVGNDKFPDVNLVLERIAKEHGVVASAVAVAWILRHPARMQTIVGTTSPTRLSEMAMATQVTLTREQWYEIYLAAGNTLP